MDISKWFEDEPTKKMIFEGIYPVIISTVKAFDKDKEVEENGKKYIKKREVISLTFKTLQAVPFPDKTQNNIIAEQQYYFDVKMHVNALNGLARAFGLNQFKDTKDFEGKVGLVGLTNREYQTTEGEIKYIAQMGWGLFSYAPMCEGAKIEYIANEIQGKPTDEQYKKWFDEHLKPCKQPK